MISLKPVRTCILPRLSVYNCNIREFAVSTFKPKLLDTGSGNILASGLNTVRTMSCTTENRLIRDKVGETNILVNILVQIQPGEPSLLETIRFVALQ